MIEARKQKEREFHDKLRSETLECLSSNKKFYSITRKSRNFVNNWLLKRSKGKEVLDYCCGNGEITIFLAKMAPKSSELIFQVSQLRMPKKKQLKKGWRKTYLFL